MSYSYDRRVRRWALLIGAPGATSEHLPGVAIDLQNYHAFLQSDHGGAWRSDEITVFESPGLDAIGWAIGEHNDIDFSVVVFSGHGHVDEHSVTRVWTNGTQHCAVESLHTFAQRQVVVIDACRTQARDLLVDKHASFGEDVGALPNLRYRASCRRLYDASIAQAEAGISYVYACSEGEAAGDTRRGGVFSRTLLTTCEDWAMAVGSPASASKMLALPIAVQHSSAQMLQRRIPQHPCIENGRRHYSFPLAVA